MEAIVLAGGFGTRLRPVLRDIPKPMAPIKGKPFLAYLFHYLKNQGVTKIIVASGYRHDIIESYFGKKYRGTELVYSIEDEPLGTGGAIKKAFSLVNGNYAIVLNGDTFFDVNLPDMAQVHLDGDADLTISVKLMKSFNRYGVVVTDGMRVIGFEEKRFRDIGYINGGVYMCQKILFDKVDPGERFSFEMDFMERYVDQIFIKPFVSHGYFIDIGVPEDYMRAQSELSGL